MKKKRMAAALLTLALLGAATLTGCSQNGQSASSNPPETSAPTSTDSGAGDLLDKITEAGVITIGTEGTYSPNSYHDESGELVGFDVEVGRKIAEKLGVEAEFVESEWDSLFAGMDAGRVDIVVNEVEYSEERALKYDFSQPYTYIHGALLVTEDNDEITGFEDLEGKRSAQNLTSSWGQMAESYGAEIVSIDALSQCVELLLTGRADASGPDWARWAYPPRPSHRRRRPSRAGGWLRPVSGA